MGALASHCCAVVPCVCRSNEPAASSSSAAAIQSVTLGCLAVALACERDVVRALFDRVAISLSASRPESCIADVRRGAGTVPTALQQMKMVSLIRQS